MDNSNWVPQEDGTHLPSEKLISAVRENPEQFPNAVDDFAALSGKSKEEVQEILNNKSFGDSVPVLGHIADVGVDLGQGLLRAGTSLTEKQAYLARKVGLDGVADFLEEDTEASREINSKIDPKFSTEVGVGETLTEGLGQAAPAIAAGIATGGTGFLASGAATTATGYLTFEDEDNLVQITSEYTDGVVPDFLVIQEDEDEDVKKLKGLAGHAISEFALAGAGHLIGRVWKAFRRGDPKVIQETLEATAEEAGVLLDDAGDALAATQRGQKSIAEFAQSAAKPVNAAEVAAEVTASAKAQNAAIVVAKEAGEEAAEHIPSQPLVRKFRNEAMGALEQTLKRSAEVNTGNREAIEAFKAADDGLALYSKQSEDVLKSLYASDYDGALDKIVSFRTTNNPEYDALWRGSVTKAALEQMESRFDDIVVAIRQDPTLKTRKAWKELTSDVFDAKLKLAEVYRESGSGSSYALLNRKLGIVAEDTTLVKAIDNAEDALNEQLKEQGYNLLSSRSDFMISKAKRLEDMGIDSINVVEMLDEMFEEFNKGRQGALASLKSNQIAQLSKAERDALENSFMRMVHDAHSSALLGQLSTTGLEVSSNFINNTLLPIGNIFGDLTKMPVGVRRAWREYAGYKAGWNHSWQTFKKALAKGKSVTDDFDILDGAHANASDYTTLLKNGKYGQYMMWRLWKGASDISIAASESQKAWRTYGMAYADGMEITTKSGLKGSAAKTKALEYASKMFDENGQITDMALRLDVQRTSWQSVVDNRYLTGQAAQFIENMRNSPSPLISTMSRATIPFFRTLINIGGDSAQTVMPFPSAAIKALKNTKLGHHAVMSARFLDDFTGANGVRAMQRAKARQRIGLSVIGGTMALLETGQIQITPPSGLSAGWDAKMAQWETLPPSSLIVGDTSIDLARFLPFSAPLLFAGILHENKKQAEMQMKGGDYIPMEGDVDLLAIYGTSLLTLTTSLMSDAGSMRGVGEVFEAIGSVATEGDPRGVYKFTEGYAKQFVPGLPRMLGKNSGLTDDDWDMYRGEGFLQEALASAGFKYGYRRLDFLGKPVQDKGRGLDPFNMKPVKVNDDVLYREYAQLSRDAGLGLTLPTPDRVFDAASWKNIGKNSSTLEWLAREEAPSLNKLKTKDGRNAYDVYREIVYQGKATKDITKSTSNSGDRNSIGSIAILKGETMEAALRRYVGWEGYSRLTPDAREKVWKTIFGVFKKEAKDFVAENVEVSPDLFIGSKYGSPIDKPTSIKDTFKAGKKQAGGIQKAKGYPRRSLDETFAID